MKVLAQNQICVQSAELLHESISEAKDAVAPVLDKIRLAAADRDIVSFGKVSETTAFNAVLKEADRTLAAVEAEKRKEDELAERLSSYFPLPPSDEEWKSLRAKLGKEALRASLRRKPPSPDASQETDNQSNGSGHENNSQIVIPENHDVIKLDKLIKSEAQKGRMLIDIARQFTDSNEKQANQLLRQIRRYRKSLDEINPPQT